MRCLQCGNEVSLLKKLSDPQFCSAEHRAQFYDEQQQLILRRLQVSASRLQSFRRASQVKSTAVPPAPAEQVPPVALFCAQGQPDLLNRPFLLEIVEALGLTGSDIAIPARAASEIRCRECLWPAISMVPWARYNPGLLSFAELDPADAPFEVLTAGLQRPTDIRNRLGLPVGRLLPVRRPELRMPLTEGGPLAANSPLDFEGAPALATSKLQRSIAKQIYGVRSPVDLRLAIPSIADWSTVVPAATLEQLVVELTPTWDVLRIDPALRHQGILFLDRVFRMRPRSGVASPRIPSFVPLDPEFKQTSAGSPEFSRFDLSPEEGTPHPGLFDRFFRARPRTGVDLAASSSFEKIESTIAESTGLEVSPAVFATSHASAVMGSSVPRHAEPRHSSGVAPADRPATFVSLEPGASVSGSDKASYPSRNIHTPPLEPSFVDRAFRMRPCSGVADQKISGLVSSTDVQPFLSRPAIIGVQPSLDATPPTAQKFFRGKPRGPAASADTAAYEQIPVGTFVESSASPVHGSFAVVERDLAPNVCERLYRMKPRGVAAGTVGDLSDIFELRPEAVRLEPAMVPLEIGDRAPALVMRMFRMRPKSGVPSERVASMQAAPFASIWPASRAVVPGFQRASVLADCTPQHISRMFRPRPRGAADRAIAAISTSNFVPMPVELETARCAYPTTLAGGPAPAFLNRMFRMRPRAPLQDESTLMEMVRVKHLRTPDPDPIFATLPSSVFEKPEPAMLDKLYRMRPRNGKTGAAENLSIPPTPLPHNSVAATGALHLDDLSFEAAKAALRRVSKNWKTSSTDLKAIVMVIPVLLLVALALVPFRAKSSSIAESTPGESSSPVQSVMSRVSTEMRNRAAIAIDDDFRGGLSRWTGPKDWEKSWIAHESGYMTPGTLGLLAPTLAMKDYRFEFSGQIVSKAMGFVVRASDERNYSAIKFTVPKNSATPSVSIVRTTVIDGKKVSRTVTPLALTVTPDTVYHVTVDVNDQYFTLMVRDQVVDFWSDALLKSGGIGFFADKGEQALIHNVRVKHQYDTLGRLVAATLPAER